MKALLMQDDCAPDALEYFEKAFLKMIGEDFESWKKSARKIIHDDDEYTVEYRKGDIRVIMDPGSPYWEVYNINPKENPEFWEAEKKRCEDSQAYLYNNYVRQVNWPVFDSEIIEKYLASIKEPHAFRLSSFPPVANETAK